MKKLLFISFRPPYPIIGGHEIRLDQTLSFLKNHFIIDILYLSYPNYDECDSIYKKNGIRNVKGFKFSFVKHCFLSLRFVFNRLPIQTNFYYSKKVQRYIDDNINNYDAVFCNTIRTTQYVNNCHNVIKYVDFIDAISMNYEKARKKTHGLMKLIYTIDYVRCKRYEREILKIFNSSSIISNIDRDYILNSKNALSKLFVVNNMVNAKPIKNSYSQREKNLIVFVGKMDYSPNILAVNNFSRNIFPIITKEIPDAKFIIVGGFPVKKVKKLQNDNIIVTGFVDDLEMYFYNSSVFVAPMLSGAGIQNKIIQAMACECCVVTTAIGAEGLNILNDEISIKDGNDYIANEIIRLLNNAEERKIKGRLAREYVLNNLSRDVVRSQFDAFIDYSDVE